MSYDVSLGVKVEGRTDLMELEDTWLNITYNLHDMFIALIGSTPNDWDKIAVEDLLPSLLDARNQLTVSPSRYEQYEDQSPKPWGTIKGMKNFLNELIQNCEDYPYAYLMTE